MLGWHQDETHTELGECHFQLDYRGETLQRKQSAFLDLHPLNVVDQCTDALVTVLNALTWDGDVPHVPEEAIR